LSRSICRPDAAEKKGGIMKKAREREKGADESLA